MLGIRWILAAFLLAFLACGGPEATESAIGTWKADMQAVRSTLKEETLAGLAAVKQGMADDAFEELLERTLEGRLDSFSNAGFTRLVLRQDQTGAFLSPAEDENEIPFTWSLRGTNLEIHLRDDPAIFEGSYARGVLRLHVPQLSASVPFERA